LGEKGLLQKKKKHLREKRERRIQPTCEGRGHLAGKDRFREGRPLIRERTKAGKNNPQVRIRSWSLYPKMEKGGRLEVSVESQKGEKKALPRKPAQQFKIYSVPGKGLL